MMEREIICNTPEDTFAAGQIVGRELRSGDLVLLSGGLGAGKTLLTKGILDGLGFDVDEVTSPSFTLVNLYRTGSLDIHHIDLWRLDGTVDAAAAVGLEELVEAPRTAAIIEWPDRLTSLPAASRVFEISIEGDGDDPRKIEQRVRSPAEGTTA
ncbi:MAG: YjeE family ATPase [Acidobacteria bacterium OLB17]|nr:MAG: YjeE family ATPase [Acidobacteria bacterium OLB17]MCZ2391415.1 tRNA (adenosine(37)-N6)-threonylcarbamoyltransferase complex ATPase subunit type 1 TsaE [Acidobacteriota bacterium]